MDLSKYSYTKQYGDGKDFAEKHDFMSWLYTQPTKGSSEVINDVTWYWCKHCCKMGSHKSDACRNANNPPAKKKSRSNAYASRASASAVKENEYSSTDRSASGSDTEESV